MERKCVKEREKKSNKANEKGKNGDVESKNKIRNGNFQKNNKIML